MSTAPAAKGSISLVSAAATGVGGLMGARLSTLLGLAAASGGSLLPFAFLLAGFAAAFSAIPTPSRTKSAGSSPCAMEIPVRR